MTPRRDASTIWRALMETTGADPLPHLAPLLHRPAWMADALCSDLEGGTALFFPTRGQSSARARQVCALCPVRAECLAYALADAELVGTWGGTTDTERVRLRRGAA